MFRLPAIRLILLGLLLVLAACDSTVKGLPEAERSAREQDFNFGWQFKLDASADPQAMAGDDIAWRAVRLPHDWSIEADFDPALDGATAYLPGGIGWYRKRFTTESGASQYLLFDGIYNHSEIWLNGQKIGGEVNGYTPFYLNISPHLRPQGKQNTLLVRVDRNRYIDSRWYAGAGIYRDVKLLRLPAVHIPPWGSHVRTPDVTAAEASVEVDVEIINTTDQQRALTVEVEVVDRAGRQVSVAHQPLTLAASERGTETVNLRVISPDLWSPEQPVLYRFNTRILEHGEPIDSMENRFGFRDFRFDANKGFFLNGVATDIRGVNLHHDAGAVGVAVPDDVWRRRLQLLKSAGVNALRMAHNPSSVNLLRLADEMGFLVQAELFDEWDNPKDKRLNQWARHDDEISRGYAHWFQTHAEQDLKRAVKRDRNHVSVFMWSIGNEIEWTYPRYKEATGYFDMNASGNYFYNPPFISAEEIKQRFEDSPPGRYVLADTAAKLRGWVKELDISRPVTANLILPSVSHQTGYTEALDVVGYSYRRVIYDYAKERYPGKMLYGSENVPQWHEWQAALEREFIPGIFLWTGVDYLGESHGAWPHKALTSGLLDTAGFTNPSYHLFKSLWNQEPHVYLSSQTEALSLYRAEGEAVVEKEPGNWQERVWIWQPVNNHWNYTPGEAVIVEVLTNCAAVELFSNGKSLGVQKLADNPDRELKWALAFEPGDLQAKGLGDCDAMDKVATAGEPSQITLQADRDALANDGYQVAHLVAGILDAENVEVRHQPVEIDIALSPNLELLGADNGDSSTMQGYQRSQLTTNDGKALILVRRLGEGPATVRVKSPGLVEAVHHFR